MANDPTLVQHVVQVGQKNEAPTVTQIKIPLPNAVLSGNLIIITVSVNISSNTPQTNDNITSVTDDKSNTYTTGPAIAGTQRSVRTFYKWNVTNGPQTITINFSGSSPNASSGGRMDFVAVSEYYNIQTSSDPLDTTTGTKGQNVAGTTDLQSVSLSTGAACLIYLVGMWDESSGATNNTQEMTQWTAGTNIARLLHADIQVMHCIGDKVETASVSGKIYHLTTSPTASPDTQTTVVLPFKQAAAGTAPGNGARVVKVHHMNYPTTYGSTCKQQFPALGTLQLLAGCSISSVNLTSITDTSSNSWTNIGSFPGDGSRVETHMAYLLNGTLADTNILTMNWSGTISQSPVWMIDAVNVAGFDKSATASGNDGVESSFTGGSLTPTNNSELIVVVLADTDNAATQSIITHSPGLALVAQTTPALATSQIDENDGFAIVYAVDKTTVTSTWGKNITNAMGDWSSILAAFTSTVVGTLEQEGHRFRNDDGSEATANWITVQDTNINRVQSLNTRLRAVINAVGSFPAQAFQLEYTDNGTQYTPVEVVIDRRN